MIYAIFGSEKALKSNIRRMTILAYNELQIMEDHNIVIPYISFVLMNRFLALRTNGRMFFIKRTVCELTKGRMNCFLRVRKSNKKKV